MKKENTLPLNTAFINQRIKELDLKQVWLASRIGVDKVTINRWTSGKVKRIAEHNSLLLAKYLECTVEDIILSKDIISAGTYADKESAIENLLSDDLISILYPHEKWDLAESIIKASIHPNIKPTKIAKLYNHLWCVNLNKNNYDQALYYAYKALSISKKSSDKKMLVISLFNISTAFALKGNYTTTLNMFNYCTKIVDYFPEDKSKAALYNNLAIIQQYFCSFDESLGTFKKCIEKLKKADNIFKFCLTSISLGELHAETGNFKEAISAFSEAYKYAVQSNYSTGIIKISLCSADVLALDKQFDEAKNMMKYDLNTLINVNSTDLVCYEMLARYYRLIGELSKALDVIDTGLSLCSCSYHPIEEARMLQERARLALAFGETNNEIIFRKKANRILNECMLRKRIYLTPILEYGSMFKAQSDLNHT